MGPSEEEKRMLEYSSLRPPEARPMRYLSLSLGAMNGALTAAIWNHHSDIRCLASGSFAAIGIGLALIGMAKSAMVEADDSWSLAGMLVNAVLLFASGVWGFMNMSSCI